MLISAYLAEGNRAEAILTYRAYRDTLNRELGVEPSPEMVKLVATLTVG